jgi:AcrR family transcriptional regulator
MATKPATKKARRRVPAAETRQALIKAAVRQFAHGGLHGTPVERIAREVGVAQPYVFSLFPTKRELFLAAVERGFEHTQQLFDHAAEEFRAGRGASDCEDVLQAMGRAYHEMLDSSRDRAWLMIQHQAYAACDDRLVRRRVRELYSSLALHLQELSGADDERMDEFLRYGTWLNVAAALGVEDLSVGAKWIGART